MLRARIVAVDEPLAARSSEAGASRPTVVAEVEEVLKGELGEPRVRFAQHGHGVAPFEPGDETLLFLIAIARSRELEALGRSGTLAWVSLQEHQDEYSLATLPRERLLGVVQAYVVADSAESAEVRQAALRRATLALLVSGDPRLAASALRELVLAPDAPLVVAEDGRALRAVIEDPGTAMGVRVALLTELERRGVVEGPPLWLELLSAPAPTSERVVAIRAAGGVAASPVRSRLLALLKDADPRVAAAAAAALGAPGKRDAVAPLAESLGSGPPEVRMAAIRGLGRIGTPEATQALERAAASHPDAATRRRARAEIDKRRATSVSR